jgi:hypothetical protein
MMVTVFDGKGLVRADPSRASVIVLINYHWGSMKSTRDLKVVK